MASEEVVSSEVAQQGCCTCKNPAYEKFCDCMANEYVVFTLGMLFAFVINTIAFLGFSLIPFRPQPFEWVFMFGCVYLPASTIVVPIMIVSGVLDTLPVIVITVLSAIMFHVIGMLWSMALRPPYLLPGQWTFSVGVLNVMVIVAIGFCILKCQRR